MPWPLITRIWFRFCCLFFACYIFFNPNGFFPFIDYPYDIYIQPFHRLIPWIGRHILHLPYEVTSFTNGSGDTTYDYVMLLFLTVLAILGCIVWTYADSRRPGYNTLYYWVTALVRYYLAFTMLNYGFSKLFKTQFPFPTPFSLMEPLGNASPMHLAWNFLGYSRGYNFFMGFAEVSSGLLLLFRRTVRIGAILSLVVAVNIMAINYGFDVCVKLLSTVMVLMALFLLLQDRERHADFFLRNRPVHPHGNPVPAFGKKWMNRSLIVLKYLLIATVLAGNIYGHIQAVRDRDPGAARVPLYGVYNVQTFILNKDTLAPLTTDTTRWRNLMVSYAGRGHIRFMNDTIRAYAFEVDSSARKIVIYSRNDTTHKSHLAYSLMGKDSLMIRGKWLQDSVVITFTKYQLDKFLLVNRGFHFINELPFQR